MYLKAYLQADKELDAFVFMQNNVVTGISIGCPLISTIPICEGLEQFAAEYERPYYFGDIIILKKTLGHGIADKLYQAHINHAKNLWTKHGFLATDNTLEFKWNTCSTISI